jgi:YbbR domain-containing protein
MAWRSARTFGLRIASLLLGTLLWLTVTGHQIERRMSVPVSYSNVPAPLVLTGDQTDVVSVHVRGDDTVVGALREGDLRVIVDLRNAEDGPNVLPLGTDEIIAPPRVDILQIDPGAISVTLEKSGEVNVPVHPSLQGQPAPGFVVKDVTVEPATVVVEGPRSRLSGNVNVITERVRIDGRTTSITQDVGLGVVDAQLRIRERAVRVTVTIEPGGTSTR